VGRLAGLVAQVAAGRGGVVWVEGEPGIGKTTLLDAAAAVCARCGVRVLRGEAEELERRLPFAAVGTALGARIGAAGAGDVGLARLSGLLRGEGVLGSSGSAASHQLAIIEEMFELVDRWCAAGPVALILDDVQWADGPSAAALYRLGRAVERDGLGLLMVLAARPVPRGEEVAELVHSLAAHGAKHLRVEPLPATAVAELVGRLLGVPAGPRLLGLVAGAGGNPMYVAELVAALRREGLVRTASVGGTVAGGTVAGGTVAGGNMMDVAELAGTRGIAPAMSGVLADSAAADPVGSRQRRHDHGAAASPEAQLPVSEWLPRSLVEAIKRRLGFLSANVRETLELAAVLGEAIDAVELSMVLDMSVTVLSEVVREATAAGLIAEIDGTLLFRHDLIRVALAANRPASVRSALRLRAGQVLAAAGAPVERVAGHLVAGATFEPATVEWLVRSAEVLTVRAPELAVLLLRQVLVTAEGGMADTLRFHLVRALLWAGDLVEAEHTASAALAHGVAPGRGGVMRWLMVQARYRQGRLGDAVATADEALASPSLTPAEAGRFHGMAALGLHVLGRFDEAEAAARRAMAAAEATVDDDGATLYGYYSLGLRRVSQGKLEQSLGYLDRALSAFEAGGRTALELEPNVLRAYALMGLDRLAEADDALAASQLCNQRAGTLYLAVCFVCRARLRFLDGRWDDALAEIKAGLDVVPDPHNYAVGLAPLAALVAIHRGVGVRRKAEEPEEPDDSPGRMIFDYLDRWAGALAEEARGSPRRALDLLYPSWEKTSNFTPPRIIYDICPDLARMATAVGDTDRSRELAADTEALAVREPSPSMEATALLCRGLPDADPAPLLDAARCFQEAGRPLYEGYAHEEAAVLLVRRGDTAGARAALDRALALYAGLDAAWDSARAQARLRKAGVRRGRRQALRARPAHGWEALTETELKVAELVAEGLSNPDIAVKMFLSRRTVQSHVSSILAKLEVGSRVEVALSARRRTLG
jgi:DNA-binding CsgD family transcriptional regulator